MSRTELIETFTAVDDNGNLQVEVWQDVIDAGHYDDPNASIRGLKSAIMVDGQRLNSVDDNTFRFVSGGKQIKRTQPI